MTIRRLNQRVVVVGLGHIGLPFAGLAAAAGFDVVGYDTDPDRVARVNTGRVDATEPGLAALVRDGVDRGRLRATDRPVGGEFIVIAVPTPLGRNRIADLTQLQAAVRSIAPFLEHNTLICIESTVPVGTTDRVRNWIAETGAEKRTVSAATPLIAHCPERCRPGAVLNELRETPRIIGGLSSDAASRAAALYSRVLGVACHVTDAATAEMVKLAENSSRDVQIAFANELAALCDTSGVNARDVIALANQHPRVDILTPGIGVGGHCLPVDPWFLAQIDPGEARMIRTARQVNDARPARIARMISDRMRTRAAAEPPVLGILGITFKPDAADLRGSPALEVLRQVACLGCPVFVADPYVTCLPNESRLSGVRLVPKEDLLSRSDIVVRLVAHSAFDRIDVPGDTEVIDFAGRGVGPYRTGSQAEAPAPIDHRSSG